LRPFAYFREKARHIWDSLFCRKLLGNRFHFLGFLNQSQTGRAYAVADLLLLPSRRGAGETWGLVVNEALQWGVSAAVSDGVGCRHDLVVPEETGWIFPAGDAMALAARLAAFARLPREALTAIRGHCEKKAAEFSLENAAGGLARAIRACAARTDAKSSPPPEPV